MAIVMKHSTTHGFEHVDLKKTKSEDLIIVQFSEFRKDYYHYTMGDVPAIVIIKGVPMQLNVNSLGGYHLTDFEE